MRTMGRSSKESLPRLEEGLLAALSALDHQVQKEVGRRTPAELATQGVQKWEPYAKRVERICSFVLDQLGANEVGLDSILILAQALPKCLQIAAADLGPTGLGDLRSGYALAAAAGISRDAELIRQALTGEQIN